MSSCAPTVIFLLSVICIAYVIILYPLLLDWMARRTSNPICNEFKERTVTILLPVCNGEAWLAAKLESIMALDYPARLVDTIVVSDGSTDGTEVIASSFASRARLQVLSLPKG